MAALADPAKPVEVAAPTTVRGAEHAVSLLAQPTGHREHIDSAGAGTSKISSLKNEIGESWTGEPGVDEGYLPFDSKTSGGAPGVFDGPGEGGGKVYRHYPVEALQLAPVDVHEVFRLRWVYGSHHALMEHPVVQCRRVDVAPIQIDFVTHLKPKRYRLDPKTTESSRRQVAGGIGDDA